MKQIPFLITPIMLFLLTGCSTIFENRKVCPSILTVDTREIPTDISGDIIIRCIGLNGDVEADLRFPRRRLPDEIDIPVDRGETTVIAWGNLTERSEMTGREKAGASIVCTSVKSSDPLLSHLKIVDTDGETARDTVRFRNEFIPATVTILTKEETYITEIALRGIGNRIAEDRSGTSGNSVLRPDPGTAMPDSSGNGLVSVCRFNFLRQNSVTGLELDVALEDENSGPLRYRYNLGQYLTVNNYDPHKDNPLPIEITLDYRIGHGFITIRCGNWEVTEKSEIII